MNNPGLNFLARKKALLVLVCVSALLLIALQIKTSYQKFIDSRLIVANSVRATGGHLTSLGQWPFGIEFCASLSGPVLFPGNEAEHFRRLASYGSFTIILNSKLSSQDCEQVKSQLEGCNVVIVNGYAERQ